MNLYAPESSLASKLQGFSKKYQMGLRVINSPETINDLIVLGDGTPDDWVVTLIAHHLNGSKIAGIVKPHGKTGTSTFDLLHDTYVKEFRALKNIVFFVDGEEKGTKDIYSDLETSLKKQHITGNLLSSQNEDKFKVYKCTMGLRQFCVATVVNGMDNLHCPTHKIEDHLILTASEMNLITLPPEIDDPKQYWHHILPDTIRDSVYKELPGHSKFVDENFPQQCSACHFLKSG